jgi:CcdB protein
MVSLTRYDIVKNPSVTSSRAFPYLIILQSPFHDELPTVIVAPVRKLTKAHPGKSKLNPVVDIGEQPHSIVVELLGPVARKSLKVRVSNAEECHFQIQGAVDFLLSGN